MQNYDKKYYNREEHRTLKVHESLVRTARYTRYMLIYGTNSSA